MSLRWPLLTVLVGGLGMVAACAAATQARLGSDGGLPPQRADTVVEGMVTSVGADPFSQIVVAAAGGDVALRGALRGEVAALVGAVVRVWGPVAANAPPIPPRSVDVRGYDVLTVGGEPVFVGWLVRRGDQLWLEGRDSVRLQDVPPSLAPRAGAKFWIGGARRGDTVVVRTYGVILGGR